MLYNVLEWVGFGIVFVGALVLFWYLQPRKLPPNPETDGDLRPSSSRARLEASLARMRITLIGGRGILPRREVTDEEKERQSHLGRFDDDE